MWRWLSWLWRHPGRLSAGCWLAAGVVAASRKRGENWRKYLESGSNMWLNAQYQPMAIIMAWLWPVSVEANLLMAYSMSQC